MLPYKIKTVILVLIFALNLGTIAWCQAPSSDNNSYEELSYLDTTIEKEVNPNGEASYSVDILSYVLTMFGNAKKATHPIPSYNVEISYGQTQALNYKLTWKNNIKQELIINFAPNTRPETLKETINLKLSSFNTYLDSTGINKHYRIVGSLTIKCKQKPTTTYTTGSITGNKITEDVYNGTGYNKKISHYDKAGRLLQNTKIAASPSGKDIISFYKYDCMGRNDSISYMAYTKASVGAELITDPVTEQKEFYKSCFPSPDDYDYAFSAKIYDASPFNVTLYEGGAGKKYYVKGGNNSPHTTYVYDKNAANEVYKYVIGAAGTVSATKKYPAGTLLRTRSTYCVTDNNCILTTEFRDSSGKLIAKATSGSNDADNYTYYVYDDMDRLRYIVPDVAHRKVKDIYLSHNPEAYRKYWYYYEYDAEGRVIMSIKPGKADEYFVYDGKGRLVMTQDGNMREENRWLYRSYDALGRETGSMLITDTGSAPLSRAEIQTLFNNDNFPGVTSSSRFRMLYTLENKFYDRYTEFSPHSFVPVEGIATADMLAQSNVGRLLYEILSILPYDDTNKLPGHVYRTYYYDKKGRLLQTVVDDTPTNTTSRYTNKYDLAGNVVATVESHTDGTTTNTKRTDYTYDRFGRLLAEKTTVNTSDPVTITYTYDEIGNLASKKLGSSGVTETYAYNLQGMLTSQDSKRMKMDYTYDTSEAGYDNTPRYDGNLSMVRWQYKTTAPKEEAYVYTYDKKGQLAGGKYYSAGTATGIYGENAQYDTNGNITRMQRMGNSADWNTDYSYNYDGNQIASINYTERTKTGTYTFTHDANGNMTNNPRRGWNYLYNHLNLLSHIVDPDAGLMCYYMWLADGTKYGVQQVQAGYTTRIYKGSFTYKGMEEANVESVSFSGGEFLDTASGFTPNYVLSDRLGSTRVVMDSKGSTIVRNSYYPFGLTHYNSLYNEKLLKTNRYHFNGKEKQTFSTQIDYELLDYGSRMYDPYLCRWTTPDPADQLLNPYIFCGNNPISYIDPDGEFIWWLPIVIYAGARLVSAGVKAAVNNQNYFERLGQDFANDAKMTWGLFKGNFEQIFTRFTFEILQTAIGYVINIGANLFTSIDDVSYYGGATVSRTRLRNWGAFTVGNFILGGNEISADPKNSLFQHEYGHYLQSQESGPIYLFRYAIPSLISASKSREKYPNHNHNFFWTELDANQRAVRYFERKISGYDDWNERENPIPGYHSYDYPGPVIIDNSKNNVYHKTTIYPKMDLPKNNKPLNNHYLAL